MDINYVPLVSILVSLVSSSSQTQVVSMLVSLAWQLSKKY
jgi:hypothetical protein